MTNPSKWRVVAHTSGEKLGYGINRVSIVQHWARLEMLLDGNWVEASPTSEEIQSSPHLQSLIERFSPDFPTTAPSLPEASAKPEK